MQSASIGNDLFGATFALAALDFALRARILAESEAAGRTGRQRDFDWVFPLRCLADYEPDPGGSVAALARARGVSPAEIAYDIMLERDGQGMVWAGFANIIDGSLEPALAMMKSPATIIGLGDGGAHYGLICDSSFPTFMLSYWGRDRAKGERLPVPSIVRALTSEAAVVLRTFETTYDAESPFTATTSRR